MDIFLNEDIKTISLSQLLVNGISPQNISSAFPNKKITAVWASVFPKNQNLSIELRNIEDLSGNTNSSSTFNLFNAQYDSAVYGDIIITEIMPVPSPSIDTIPAVEYVEIYNRSAKYINLANYTFSDASNTVTLPDSSIAPYSYAILSKKQR